MSNSKKQIIIDTDMGWDDVLAILYLLKKPEIDIVGITVTGCGETNLEWGVKIAQALSALYHKPIPVASGTEKPMKYNFVFPQGLKDDMNTIMGRLDSLYPENPIEVDPRPAWQFLAEEIKASEDPVTILSLGGFTNMAKMLEVDPQLNRSTKCEIVAMAGAVDVKGNIDLLNSAQPAWNQGPLYGNNHSAEWNVFVDPLAAKIVFESEIPLTLIPLDACNYVVLNPEYATLILAKDKISSLAKEILVKKTTSHDEGIPVPIFDPLAAVYMADGLKDIHCINEYLDVVMDVSEADNRCGTTIKTDSGSRKIRIVNKVSQLEFAEELSRTLNL